MDRRKIKIVDVVIENFKNVEYGHIAFDSRRSKQYSASILGLFGQNGSGKTALIEALALLKIVLSGDSIPEQFANFINVSAEFARLQFGLKITLPGDNTEYDVKYSFCIRKDKTKQTIENRVAETEFGMPKKSCSVIFDETFSFGLVSSMEKRSRQPVINTATDADRVFVPAAQYKRLFGSGKDVKTDLTVIRKFAEANSKSFIFSEEFINKLNTVGSDRELAGLIGALLFFGKFQFFVVSTVNSGIISLNSLPLAFMLEKERSGAGGTFVLLFDKEGVAKVPSDWYVTQQEVIDVINVVLPSIVPSLTLHLKNFGKMSDEHGNMVEIVQLTADKNGVRLPFVYESEGIKKIVSVLSLLISVYNNPAVVVAVDELDSGVFEYLLGELLRIMELHAKGQLIFTAHNLRPLETLDKCFVAFTTTNPQNRYIRPKGVMENNNLRAFYYRDIVLGGQDEETYQRTNNSEIAFALKKAGR